MYFQDDKAAITPSNVVQHRHTVNAHLITGANHRDPLVILKELHAANCGVILKQNQGGHKRESEPNGRKFLDQRRLVFLEKRQNDNGPKRGQPGDD